MTKPVLHMGSIFTGLIINDEGRLACAKCKNPDTKGVKIAHMDKSDCFLNTYRCDCGNLIGVATKRKGKYTESDLEGSNN